MRFTGSDEEPEVGGRKKAGEAVLHPSSLREGLALGAVAVAAGVEDEVLVGALRTSVDTPAEDGSPAGGDGSERLALLRLEEGVAAKGRAVSASDRAEGGRWRPRGS